METSNDRIRKRFSEFTELVQVHDIGALLRLLLTQIELAMTEVEVQILIPVDEMNCITIHRLHIKLRVLRKNVVRHATCEVPEFKAVMISQLKHDLVNNLRPEADPCHLLTT